MTKMDCSKISLKSERINLPIADNHDLSKKLLDVSIMLRKTTMFKGLVKSDSNLDEETSVILEMTLAIYTDIPEFQLESTKMLRKLLCRDMEPPIDDVITFGIIPRFVTFLSYFWCEMLQFEAAWALTNICSGTSIQTRYVIEAGAVPAFIKLLSSNSVSIQEQALWGIGNIAGDSKDFREHVLNCGVVPPLNTLVTNTIKVFTLQIAAWTLANLCREKSSFNKISKSIPAFKHLVNQDDKIALSRTFWALSYLSEGDGDRIQCVIDADILPLIVERLVLDDSVVHPALHIVGNVCMGDDIQTQAVLDCNILAYLPTLLTTQNESIRRLACWIISNLLAGSVNQIQTVVDSNIIPILFQVLINGSVRSKKEVVWAIKNVTTHGSSEHMSYLIEKEVINYLCNLLSQLDIEILTVSLISLENFLHLGEKDVKNKGKYNTVAVKIEECNGLDKIEQLQSHDNIDIYRRAYEIIETYFGSVESTVYCGNIHQ